MVIYENFDSSDLSSSFLYIAAQHKNRKRFGLCAPNSPNKEWLKYRSPLGVWLEELKNSTEVECLNALQAKSVATTSDSFEALSIRNSQVSIQQIRKSSTKIIDSIDNFIDHLPITYDDLKTLKAHFSQICYKIHSVIEICRRKGCDFSPNKKKLSVAVSSICQQAIKFINIFIMKRNVNNAQLEATLRKLKENFGELIDHTIKKECQVITTALYSKTSHLCLKWSLLAFWQLTQNDAYICRIFIESQNIIKPLIDTVNNYSSISLIAQQEIKAAALRVLTFLCINKEAVKQIFDECVSSKCIISLVLNESSDIIVREAVGLMVQLTTPFIDSTDKTYNNDVWNLSNRVLINDMVHCLTEVAKTTCNQEIFLLTCAALANISFMDSDSLVKNETVTVLVNASRQRINFDEILLKDQIITLLANIARKYPLEIVSSGGLVFLLCSLQLRPSVSLQKQHELLAIERIQQKVSVALARLGSHKSAAKLIYKLNGVQRLVQLCKDAKERNFSDTVLLACIAALRRIAQSIGKFPFKELECLDLIDLKLQETFVLYTSKNESIV